MSAPAAGGGTGGAVEEAALIALPPVTPSVRVPYGTLPSQVIDVYLPADGAVSKVVTLLHGGYWRQRYDRRHLSPLAAELARRGMLVALAEYRRIGGGGGWPATFEDVREVLARTPELVRELVPGRSRVGPPHWTLLGHSAGGQLALWAASLERAEPRPADWRVGRVVAVAPVADLGRAHQLGLSAGAVAALLGGADRVSRLLPLTDPIRRTPVPCPVTLLHGTADAEVPMELSRRYLAANQTAGGRTVLRALPGVGHYAPVTPGTPAAEALYEALRPA